MTALESLSMGQFLLAKRLRASNPYASVRFIAKRVGATGAQIGRAVGFGKTFKPKIDLARLSRETIALKNVREEIVITPDHVMAEFKRAHSGPFTLGMIYLGDPLPGRSALDKQKTAFK